MNCPFRLIEIDADVARASILIEGFIEHLCPFKDEKDVGSISVRYTPWENEIELHGLAEYFDSFEDIKVSHEDLTRRIKTEIDEWVSPRLLVVRTKFKTAGLTVNVEVS